MDDAAQIEQAIAALEAQRAILGDAVVNTALAPLREKLEALRPKPDVQRKLVTFLFTDVVSSSKTFGHLDPEDTLEILSGWLDRAGEIVKAHGGYVARLMGDGLLAFFGAQTSREDDPVRAVRTALALCTAAQEYAQVVAARWKIDGFNVRVGLNSGQVALGEVGGEAGSEFTAMGDAINMASRMESNAPPGGVLISQATYHLVRGLFDLEAREPILPKGALEPIPVYVVLREKPYEFRPATRGLEGIATPMVGRDAELLQLQHAYEIAVEDGETQFVTIVGEAGVGKSRLLYEFTEWARARPDNVLWLKVRAMPESASQPFIAMRNLIADHFGILDTDSMETMRAKLEVGLTPYIPIPEALPQAVEFAQGMFSDGTYRAQQSVELVHENQLRLLMAMQRLQPVVILLDDIHWMDDKSLDTLNRLIEQYRNLHVLLVALARPTLFERRPHWGEGQEAHLRLTLRPLSSRDSRRLVAEMLSRVDSVPDELRTLIVENAEGNPFYLEELVRMLIDERVIVAEGERWQVAADRLAEMRVPTTLLGVLQARLESLPQEERLVLQRAAVVGRTFWDQAVERLRADGSTDTVAAQILSSLRGRDLIFAREQSVFAGAHEFIFKHALLRDATYGSVVRKLRREYHRQAAEWLVEACGDRAGEHMAEIAYHYEQAGDIARAIDCLKKSGDLALRVGALDEARVFYQRALAMLPDDTRENQRLRADLMCSLGEAIWFAGDDAVPTLKGVISIGESINAYEQVARAYVLLAMTAMIAGDMANSESYARSSLDAAQNAQAPGALAMGQSILGWVSLMNGGTEEASRLFASGLKIARELGDPEVLAWVMLGMGEYEIWYGTAEAASEIFGEILGLAQQAGDNVGVTWALSGLGRAAFWRGEFDAARRYFDLGLENALKTKERTQLVRMLNHLALLDIQQSNLESSRRRLAQALKELRSTENFLAVIEFLGATARYYIADGQPQRGLALLGLALFHPASPRSGLDQIRRVMFPQIQNALPPEAFAAALESGKSLDLQATLAALDFST